MAANQNGSHAGKVAFVTGAGSGIGRATTQAIAHRSTGAVCSDRRSDPLMTHLETA
jgi:NAD(P)-dependent dehydrogenase (short-subunit alcohol dehydrogenase family)